MSNMRDAEMPLRDRIEAAIKRITHREGLMRVPVEATDPDIVLRDCQQEIDRLTRELAEARAELECERMRLVACGVVAMSNTSESAARSREMHADYRSASCDDVARAVDREMALRAERDALAKDAERYRWMRDRELPEWMDLYHQHPARVDAAIDAQIEQERSEQAKERV